MKSIHDPVKNHQRVRGAAWCLVCLITIGATSTSTHAELLVYEPFDYAAEGSTILTGQGGALGTTGVWASNNRVVNEDWAVHQEGVLSGVVLSDEITPSSFDGTVDNLPTSGGYTGFTPGGDQLTADIGLDPSVTESFTDDPVTWISYVSAKAWNLNEEHPNLVLATDPAPTPSRGDVFGGIGTGGSGFGTGGGPTRNNRTTIYPMFYAAGQYNNSTGAVAGNSYGDSAHEVPGSDLFVWEEADAGGNFGAPNIVVMKLEWNADDDGKDILSVVRFLEADTLTEVDFDSAVAAQPNLSTANWPDANKPDLDQSTLDTITFTGVKYFVDEIRLGTSFEDVVGGTAPSAQPFAITEFSVDEGAETVELTWRSRPGKMYLIGYSHDLSSWDGDLADGIPHDVDGNEDEFTTFTATYDGTPISGEAEWFLRIEEQQ